MLRNWIMAWRARRLAAEADVLAGRLGPHLARDIGLCHADWRQMAAFRQPRQ